MNAETFYPIGTPGTPWGDAERAAWRSLQRRQRSYADDVVTRIERLRSRFDVETYGELDYPPDRYPLRALRSRQPRDERPLVLVTGGVHGYETSGVHGALHFLAQHADSYAGRIDLLVVPCVSPWAYERVHRWNPHTVDPNRAFRDPSPAEEAAALMRLLAPVRERVLVHIDLHETTDTDETEFRPALAARDGKAHDPDLIPDGFYLVGDSDNPQLAFQSAVIAAVARVRGLEPDLQRVLMAEMGAGYVVAQLDPMLPRFTELAQALITSKQADIAEVLVRAVNAWPEAARSLNDWLEGAEVLHAAEALVRRFPAPIAGRAALWGEPPDAPSAGTPRRGDRFDHGDYSARRKGR